MLTLDAWLEHPAPRVRILDDHSRRVVAEWKGEELAELLETGRLCADDCRSHPGAETEHELIRELLLESCLGDLSVARRTAAPLPSAADCRPARPAAAARGHAGACRPEMPGRPGPAAEPGLYLAFRR